MKKNRIKILSLSILIKKNAKNIKEFKCGLCVLILLLIASCDKNNESKINKSIQNLTEKYPLLTAGKKTPESEFKFTKSVREGEFNMEIQLYSQAEGYENRNHIIVIINAKNEICSIPLFNNKYKDYWEFPFDTLDPNVPKINTTFSNQINNAIDILIKNNDWKKGNKRYVIMNVMLNSVLNCKNIKEKDSVMIYKTLRGSFDIPDENSDVALKRLRKNYDMMKLDWHPEEYMENYNCFLDEKNARIYQIEYLGNKIKIKTYRQDYGMHYMYL
jgi:hypothetical protein